MLKKLLAIGLVSLVAGWAYAGDWFDMQNCGICKCMGDHMDIMGDITWETHKLPNGVMSVSVIPDEHKATMKEAHDKMMGAVKRFEEGESMDLCGHCESYGELLGMGAQKHEIESSIGTITIMTSDDPEVVKKIHAHTDRSNEEYKKMMTQMQNS